MLLNVDELMGFIHLPSSDVRLTTVLQRQRIKSRAAPAIVQREQGLLLGQNEHAGETMDVQLTREQRVRHCHLIGTSGTGKSTLLFNLIRQDIENGEGVAVLDPHGDLVDRILGIIPAARMEDVVLVDPSDEQFPVGFNTRVVFHVGDDDAKKLAEGFSHFEASDLRNLETFQSIIRVERSDYDFNVAVRPFERLDADQTAVRREKVITCSRRKYGTPRSELISPPFRAREGVTPEEPPSVKPGKAPSSVVQTVAGDFAPASSCRSSETC